MSGYTNKDIAKVIAQNIFRHKKFWNLNNFKNRLHVLLLMALPVSCKDKKLRASYNTAKYNFWSACGDDMDYKFFIGIRQRLQKCNTK